MSLEVILLRVLWTEVLVSAVLSPTLAALPVPQQQHTTTASVRTPPSAARETKEKKEAFQAPPIHICNWSIVGTMPNEPIKSPIVFSLCSVIVSSAVQSENDISDETQWGNLRRKMRKDPFFGEEITHALGLYNYYIFDLYLYKLCHFPYGFLLVACPVSFILSLSVFYVSSSYNITQI